MLMKKVLICPGERPALASLAEAMALVQLPVLGKSLLEHWLEQVARQGTKEVLVLTTDRLKELRRLVGEGERWGLRVEVRSEVRELSLEEARHKYRLDSAGSEGQAVLIDHLPQLPGQPVFESYAAWLAAVERLLAKQLFPTCVGLREVKPGVWVGRRSRIARDAELRGPCWIGENVWIDSGAIVGPGAIVENRAFIGKGAEIVQSLIGPETFVGENTDVKASLACGGKLINGRMNSVMQMPDPWLLCALRERHVRVGAKAWRRQLDSWLMMGLSLPVGMMTYLKSKLEGAANLRRIGIRE
jgi:NDP-sugar pyrophosphorylase family protein